LVNLEPDKLTYFHYPLGNESIPLSSTGLVEAGAIAGTSPEKADRIWKAQSGYNTHLGNSLGIQNGTWLCSWLKGSAFDCNAQWMDRWYDPSKISFKLALSSEDPNPYIVDIPSTMTMDAGVLYKFFHIGKDYSFKLIEDTNFSKFENILEVKDWSNITVTNGTSANIVYTRYNESELNLNGTEYVEFSSSNSFYPEYQLSLASWVNFDNWRNAPADQIVGNYYKGGYGLFFNTGVKTDTVIFADKQYGHLFIANTENKYFHDKALPGLSATVTDISYDNSGIVWVLDGNNNKIYAYNPLNNLFVNTINLALSSNYTLIENDKEGNIFAYDAQNNRFSKYNNRGSFQSHQSLN